MLPSVISDIYNKLTSSKNDLPYDVREFLKYDAQCLWSIFGNVEEQTQTEKKIMDLLSSGEDEAWLSIMEECIFLIIDPRKELNLIQFLKNFPPPNQCSTIERITQRLTEMVCGASITNDTRYNILLVLLVLGNIAIKDIAQERKVEKSRKGARDDAVVKNVPKYKFIFNNQMINLIWILVHSNDNFVKVMALSVIHLFIENYESVQPPAIEEYLNIFLRKSLVLNKNPEIQFLTKFIAEHTYGAPIIARTEQLEEERNRSNKISGKGKIFLEAHDGILLDSDGTTARNHSLIVQCCTISKHMFSTLEKITGVWYWEVIVASARYTKVGYEVLSSKGEVQGLKLNIDGTNNTFGILLDCDKRLFRVYSKTGQMEETSIPSSVSKFYPCAELGPLQQLSFNFGKPILEKPAGNILSELKCPHKTFEYTPPKSFRQKYSLPTLHQEYILDYDKEKNAKTPPAKSPSSKKRNVRSPRTDKISASHSPKRAQTKKVSSPKTSSRTNRPEKTESARTQRGKEKDGISSALSTPTLPSQKKLKREEKEPKTPVQEKDEESSSEEYLCPITKEIMTDPVIAEDGYRYERDAIAKWLATNSVSPMTRQPMDPNNLQQDTILKNRIEARHPRN